MGKVRQARSPLPCSSAIKVFVESTFLPFPLLSHLFRSFSYFLHLLFYLLSTFPFRSLVSLLHFPSIILYHSLSFSFFLPFSSFFPFLPSSHFPSRSSFLSSLLFLLPFPSLPSFIYFPCATISFRLISQSEYGPTLRPEHLDINKKRRKEGKK